MLQEQPSWIYDLMVRAGFPCYTSLAEKQTAASLLREIGEENLGILDLSHGYKGVLGIAQFYQTLTADGVEQEDIFDLLQEMPAEIIPDMAQPMHVNMFMTYHGLRRDGIEPIAAMRAGIKSHCEVAVYYARHSPQIDGSKLEAWLETQ